MHAGCLVVLVKMLAVVVVGEEDKWIEECKSDNYCHAAWPMIETYETPLSAVSGNKMKLANVQIITRHGDRTPVADPKYSGNFWSELVDGRSISTLHPSLMPVTTSTPGMLTKLGQEQQVQLGLELSNIYADLIATLADNQVIVTSTSSPRTYLSAHWLLSGLFSRSSKTQIVPNIELRPTIIPSVKSCPRLSQLLKQTKSSSSYRSFADKMRKLQAEAIDDPNVSFSDITDTLLCRACHNISFLDKKGGDSSLEKQPKNLESYCEIGKKAFSHLLEQVSEHKELVRLQTGPLLRQIANSLLQYHHQKLTIFSAHDTTIGHLNSALQTGQYQWPPYASNFIIELWEDQKRETSIWAEQFHVNHHFVRIVYNGKVVNLSWCLTDDTHLDPSLCPLSKFLAYTKDLTPVNDEQECMSVKADEKNYNLTEDGNFPFYY